MLKVRKITVLFTAANVIREITKTQHLLIKLEKE